MLNLLVAQHVEVASEVEAAVAAVAVVLVLVTVVVETDMDLDRRMVAAAEEAAALAGTEDPGCLTLKSMVHRVTLNTVL